MGTLFTPTWEWDDPARTGPAGQIPQLLDSCSYCSWLWSSCGTPKGLRNQQEEFWENPGLFFFPLLSTGLSLFQQLSWLRMLSEAGGYGSYWAQATTSSPHAYHSSQSCQRGLCALLYVTCQSIPSYFISLLHVFPYKLYKEQSRLLEERTSCFSQNILPAIPGQGVFMPTSLTTWEKANI